MSDKHPISADRPASGGRGPREKVPPGEKVPPRRRAIASVETAMELLAILAAAPGPMMLKEIAEAATMPPAKVHRYLAAFVSSGMVAQEHGSARYELGPLAMRLGAAALSRLDVVERACARLAALRDVVRATCFVACWGARGPFILRWEDSRQPVTVNVQAGSDMPLLTSATGRVFLAYMPPDMVEPILAGERQGAGGWSRAKVARVAADTRAAGLGRVQGDFQAGIDALSAPLIDPLRGLVGAVTALGLSGHIDAALDGEVAMALKRFADDAAGAR
jgi:DNA-binding IclR family transcriptional regulator